MRSIPCLFVALCVVLAAPGGRLECASPVTKTVEDTFKLGVVSTTMTQIVLQWSIGWTRQVSSFAVERATNSAFSSNFKSYALDNVTYVFSDTNRTPISQNRFMGDSGVLASGTTYYYRVKANLTGGGSLYSNAINAQVSGPVRGQEGDLWADIVLGKPDFCTNAPYRPSKYAACFPGGVLIDKTVTPNRMYIVDCNNNRVLGFNSTSPTDGANIVLGQPDFLSGGGNGDSCAQLFPYGRQATASSLCFTLPTQISMGETVAKAGMAVDAQGNLFVADDFNHRVLKYNNPFGTDAIADEVWGQANFTANLANRGGSPAANSFNLGSAPRVAIGPDGSLWVTDTDNNRVLRFPKNQQTGVIAKTADLVLGQANFTTNTAWGHTRSLARFWMPAGIGFDAAGNLYVSDGNTAQSDGRILFFQPPFSNGMTATRKITVPIPVNVTDPAQQASVICATIVPDVNPNRMWFENGQNTGASELVDLTSGGNGVVVCSVPVAQSSGIDVDSDGNLYAVNKWGGVYRYPASSWPLTWQQREQLSQEVFYGARNIPTADSTGGILGITTFKDQLIVSENSRMLIWNNWNVDSATTGQPADDLYGEATFTAIPHLFGRYFVSPQTDKSGRLWECHRENGHILEAFAYPLTQNSIPIKSIQVAGDPPLTVKGGGTISGMWADFFDFAVEGTGDKIWVADSGASRVFRINNIDRLEDQHSGPYVDIVLGQNNLTDSARNLGAGDTVSAKGLAQPYDVDISPNGELMIADNGGEVGSNRRIIIYDVTRFPNAPATCLFANNIGNPDRVVGTGGRFDIAGYLTQDPMCSPFGVGISSNETVVSGMNGYSGQRFPLVYLNPRKSTQPQMALGDFTAYPTSCFVDKDGNVYVGDWDWSRVLIYKKPFKAFVSPTDKIGGLKGLPDGFPVALTGNIVTAAPGAGGVPAGVFYMESPDRSSGIRVASTTVPTIGQTAAVNGTMATTADGERYVAAVEPVFLGDGSALGALGTNTSDLSTGLMEGLLVRVSGIVRGVGADSFTIADGYFKVGAEVQTTVKTGTAPSVGVGNFVSVTGIASREQTRTILWVPSIAHHTLTGHVYGSAGTGVPIMGASVAVDGGVPAMTDATGYYQIWDSPAGDVTIDVSAAGYVPQSITINIPVGEDVVQDFHLSPGPSPAVLNGHVYGGSGTGTPLAGVSVLIGGSGGTTVVTNSSGFYQLIGAPTGSVPISVSGVSGYYPYSSNVSIAQSATVTYDMHLSPIGSSNGLPFYLPMDQQVNIGLGDSITSFGALSFQPAGGGEPDGWCRSSWPNAWRGPNVDFTLATGSSLDCSDPNTVMEWDLRYYQAVPYAQTPITLVMADMNWNWRNYGRIYSSVQNPVYPTWTHVTILLNNGASDGFDTSHIRFMQIYNTDTSDPGPQSDFIDAKKMLIHVVP